MCVFVSVCVCPYMCVCRRVRKITLCCSKHFWSHIYQTFCDNKLSMTQPGTENVLPLLHLNNDAFSCLWWTILHQISEMAFFFPLYLCWCPGTLAKAAFGPVCWGTRWCRTPRTHRQLPGWIGSQTPSGWKQSRCVEWLRPASEWPN